MEVGGGAVDLGARGRFRKNINIKPTCHLPIPSCLSSGYPSSRASDRTRAQLVYWDCDSRKKWGWLGRTGYCHGHLGLCSRGMCGGGESGPLSINS